MRDSRDLETVEFHIDVSYNGTYTEEIRDKIGDRGDPPGISGSPVAGEASGSKDSKIKNLCAERRGNV